MPNDYYVILGIGSDATSEQVKRAFRRRSLELHPDRTGLESGPFQQLQEAYGVLGDPERRRHYDRQTRRSPVRFGSPGPTAEPLKAKRPWAEPIRPVEPASGFRTTSLANSFERYGPSFEELFDRLWRNFATMDRPKAERLESLTVEMVLGAEEARFGGRVRLEIPARAACPACGGRGGVWPHQCWRCQGRGALTAQYPVQIEYPPGTRDGYAVRIPLDRFGIDNFYLTVLFRVTEAREP